jgi:hypothetical protein
MRSFDSNLLKSVLKDRVILRYFIVTLVLYLTLYIIEIFRKLSGTTYEINRNLGVSILSLTIYLWLIYNYFFILRYTRLKELSVRLILILAFVFHCIPLFVRPVFSSDVLNYVSLSRLVSEHQANPYLETYFNFTQDIFYDVLKIEWSNCKAFYGPIFVMIGSFLTFLAGEHLNLSIFLFKAFFIGVNISNSYLIYKITRKIFPMVVYAWNPLLIFNFALDGHNDVVGVFFFLLSILFLQRKQGLFSNLASFSFLVLAILTKVYFLVFLPVFMVYVFKGVDGIRELLSYLFYFFVLGSVISIVAYFPFFEGFHIFSHYSILMNLYMPNSAPGILIFSKILSVFMPHNAIAVSAWISQLIFFLLSFIVFKRMVLRRQIDIVTFVVYSAAISFLFFFFYVTWLWSWYLTIIFALIAIAIGLVDEPRYLKYYYLVVVWGSFYYFFALVL